MTDAAATAPRLEALLDQALASYPRDDCDSPLQDAVVSVRGLLAEITRRLPWVRSEDVFVAVGRDGTIEVDFSLKSAVVSVFHVGDDDFDILVEDRSGGAIRELRVHTSDVIDQLLDAA